MRLALPRAIVRAWPPSAATGITAATALATLFLLAVADHGLAQGWPERVRAEAARWTAEAQIAAGLELKIILIEGRQEADQKALLAALGASRGAPILDLDLAAARARLEANEWVKHATITRQLPDALHVRIEERQPAALWQMDGKFALIDRDGVVIGGAAAGRFVRLPQLVGAGAPVASGALLAALSATPEIATRLRAATRVGERRWTLHMDSGQQVLLPEGEPAPAIARLGQLERDSRILSSEPRTLDLRQPDRLIVDLPTKPSPTKKI